MSKIHVLSGDGTTYNVILHFNVLTGSNSANKTWKNVFLQSGVAHPSALTVGTGPGQITQAESDSIIAGDIIEFQCSINASDATTAAAATEIADGCIAEERARLQNSYKWYGLTLGTVS